MNIFQNPTKTLPKTADSQIVRVPMTENQLGGRTDHMPSPGAGNASHSGMTIDHVKSK